MILRDAIKKAVEAAVENRTNNILFTLDLEFCLDVREELIFVVPDSPNKIKLHLAVP